MNEGLSQVPTSGGPVTHFGSRSAAVATDETHVYWSNFAGAICKMPLGGGSAVTLATGQTATWQIAVDATSVYWGEGSAIRRVPK